MCLLLVVQDVWGILLRAFSLGWLVKPSQPVDFAGTAACRRPGCAAGARCVPLRCQPFVNWAPANLTT